VSRLKRSQRKANLPMKGFRKISTAGPADQRDGGTNTWYELRGSIVGNCTYKRGGRGRRTGRRKPRQGLGLFDDQRERLSYSKVSSRRVVKVKYHANFLEGQDKTKRRIEGRGLFEKEKDRAHSVLDQGKGVGKCSP